MDGEHFDEQLAEDSYNFIVQTNRLFGAYAPIKKFITRLVKQSTSNEPLQIIDVGSGIGDIPNHVSQALISEPHQTHFTCVEYNEHAITMGKKHYSNNSALTFIQADAFSFTPADKTVFDGATACMFLHHLSYDEIGQLINHLSTIVRGRILICDLHRSLLPYLATWIWSIFQSSGVRHDALLSIQKGFTRRDLKQEIETLDCVEKIIQRGGFGLRMELEIHLKYQEGK